MTTEVIPLIRDAGPRRKRLQVPFREDLQPLLHVIAARESRSMPNAATHILESVIRELGLRMADRDPEFGLELEQCGVRLDDGPSLSSVLAEVLQ